MRAFVTGGTGFIGGRMVERLLDDGWDVTALVRSPERAARIRERGATLVPGDVTEPETFSQAIKGADAVFHLAAYYALGVSDREQMMRINVDGTKAVLRAAGEAAVPRILYCSSIAALGSGPPGSVGDETREHHGDFPSIYEESKWRAHQIALGLAKEGLPIVSVMPGAVYGPGDVSFISVLLGLYARRRLVVCSFRDAAASWVHVDDVVDGMVRASEKAPAGETYVLGGDNESIGGLLERVAPYTGIKPPRLWVPDWVARASMPLSPLFSRLLKQAPGAVRDGTKLLSGSIAFSSSKAQRDFAYRFRPIEEGLPPYVETLAVTGQR
ncbi:MAG TPA: NAD-dependent epimerase/dehydratase family protein [Actinomycetota bacterium]|nr:NAD-dependent epimerase/dehydratase family protein [Actinomycetota bacterium]